MPLPSRSVDFRDFTRTRFHKRKKSTHASPSRADCSTEGVIFLLGDRLSPSTLIASQSPRPSFLLLSLFLCQIRLKALGPGARQVADTCIDLFRVRVDRG